MILSHYVDLPSGIAMETLISGVAPPKALD